jgi:hypothetical protein
MQIPGYAVAQPGGMDTMMTKTPGQTRPGTTRKVLVVVALFATAIAFYVASFLIGH